MSSEFIQDTEDTGLIIPLGSGCWRKLAAEQQSGATKTATPPR
jgi:hypothetical protein